MSCPEYLPDWHVNIFAMFYLNWHFIGWAVSLGGGTNLPNSCRGYYVPCNKLLHFSLTAHLAKALLVRGGVDAEWDYSRTYVNSYLSTTATPSNACPQRSPTAKITSRQRAVFFSDWWKSSRMDPYDTFMTNRSCRILIGFFIYTAAVSKNCNTILLANAPNLARFVTLAFWFKG